MNKRPLKVFLCHAHADRDAVRTLYTRLTNDGVDAWLDKEKLLPGQDWELEIKKAVREADVVVVCLSKQFNQAGFRQKEVRLALDTAMEKPEGEIFIIPARLEECDNLESLRKWHWVDLFEDDGYETLMRALRARANNIGATLQIKRSWLPKITSPLPKKQKPVENKTAETVEEKIQNTTDDLPPPPEFPDGWDKEWQPVIETDKPNVIGNPQEEKLTALKPKKEFQLPKILSRNLMRVFGFIVLVMASVFGLPPLFNSPVETPSPTQTETAIILETQLSKPSSTPSILTSTITPVFTATPTPVLAAELNYPFSEGVPLPEISASISADNAGDVVELAKWVEGSAIDNITFSPDGTILAYSTNENLIKLRSIKNGVLLYSLDGGSNPICKLLFSPNGESLASGDCIGSSSTIRLWQVNNGDLLHIIKNVYTNARYMDFSPDGELLAIGVNNGADKSRVHIRQVNDGKLIQILEVNAWWSRNVAFSSNGKLLASQGGFPAGIRSDYIYIWDMDNNGRLLNKYPASSLFSPPLVFSPDGKYLISQDFLLDIDNLLVVPSADNIFLSKDGRAIAYSGDTPLHESRGDDYRIKIWGIDENIFPKLETAAFSFSVDGRVLIHWHNSAGTISLIQSDNAYVIKVLEGDAMRSGSLAVSPDGKLIVSGSNSGELHVWGVAP